MKSYKELIVWQRGMELVKAIYSITQNLPREELYGLSDQMRRSAISIPSNIAEGQQRKSTKEFKQFLSIAYVSAGELETQLSLSKDLYPKIDHEHALFMVVEVQKMLNGIRKKLTDHWSLNTDH